MRLNISIYSSLDQDALEFQIYNPKNTSEINIFTGDIWRFGATGWAKWNSD